MAVSHSILQTRPNLSNFSAPTLSTTPSDTSILGVSASASPSTPSGRPNYSRVDLRMQHLNGVMDVREALARCEDPTLGWSMQFWVTIADPLTQHVFFACPASGQCSWDPPVGAFVVPRSPDGEWWELADASQNNRSYYYNTLTGKTQWTRPNGDAFVIPLGLIQRNALPVRPTGHPSTPRTIAVPPTSPSPATTPVGPGNSSPALMTPTMASHERDPVNASTPQNFSALRREPLTVVEEGSGNESDLSDQAGSGMGWWDKKKSKGILPNQFSPKRVKTKMVPESVNGQSKVAPNIKTDSSPESPIYIESSVRTKRMSTGLHPVLPTDISSQIQSFQTQDFAAKYFATKRSGVLRSRVPLERIMEWQKQPISSPLLVLSRNLAKDAALTFKVIQHVMGDRDKPVEQAKATASSSSISPRNSTETTADKLVVLEEVRWLIQIAVTSTDMRDEVYSQLIKQLCKNPEHDSVVLGFQLFCVFVNAFPPSKNFHVFVQSFLSGHIGNGTDGLTVMAKYCQTKLESATSKGARCRILTIGEIEHASDAAFYPSVYGETLDRIMKLQARSYPSLQIPVILPFLADGILALGGLSSEGIFRVPGDNDSVLELRSRIDRGHYQLKGINDPHVAASLFKLWLRELEEPLIPSDMYNDALTASKTARDTLALVVNLPRYHRRVLVFVISFAQLFLKPSVVAVTKMTAQNIALVLAPNILRTTSNHLETVFTNSGFESKFILQLLNHLDPATADPDFAPTHGPALAT